MSSPSHRGYTRTICNLTVLPSSSIVRIFCSRVSSRYPLAKPSGTYEIDANGGDVGLGVGIIGESQQQAGLSDAGVTNKQELEEVIVSEPMSIFLGRDVQSLSMEDVGERQQ